MSGDRYGPQHVLADIADPVWFGGDGPAPTWLFNRWSAGSVLIGLAVIGGVGRRWPAGSGLGTADLRIDQVDDDGGAALGWGLQMP